MAQTRDPVSRPCLLIVGFRWFVATSWPAAFVSAWTSVLVAVSAPGFVAPVVLFCGTREPIRESLPDSKWLAARSTWNLRVSI